MAGKDAVYPFFWGGRAEAVHDGVEVCLGLSFDLILILGRSPAFGLNLDLALAPPPQLVLTSSEAIVASVKSREQNLT